MKRIFLIFSVILPLVSLGQTPTVDPYAIYTMEGVDGEVDTDTLANRTEPLQAPVVIEFFANPDIPSEYVMTWCKWTISNQTNEDFSTINRYEANIKEDFSISGTYQAKFEAQFINELTNDTILVPDLEAGEDPVLVNFTISESKLEFPNAFSPNGDEKNDILKPIGKRGEGYKSIVSFHAAVFNRWGKKLYSWDDVDGGWDGMVGGKPVKDGVYFLVVSAKGADGIDYNIKKAINVLTGFNERNEGGGDGAGE